jgi:hypothetical protein
MNANRWKRIDTYDYLFALSSGDQSLLLPPLGYMPNIYMYNEGESLSFYENQTAIIEAVFNQNPADMKEFSAHGLLLETDDLGEFSTSEVKVPPTQGRLQEQSSSIPQSSYEKVHGAYWSPFLRDANTPDPTGNAQYLLLEGDQLQGYGVKMKFEIRNTKKTILYGMVVSWQPITPIL